MDRLSSQALTLSVVLLGWVFFRAVSFTDATHFLGRLLTFTSDGACLMSPFVLVAVALVLLLVNEDFNWAEDVPKRSLLTRILSYSALAILLAALGSTDAAPFIYLQF